MYEVAPTHLYTITEYITFLSVKKKKKTLNTTAIAAPIYRDEAKFRTQITVSI